MVNLSVQNGASVMVENNITIVEHPGYLETLGEVFDIEPGEYLFTVINQSQKDSGFVVMRDGEVPIVVPIKKGETVIVNITLKTGNYNYFCSLIPTPTYSIRVR
jgi:hypothetical protein